MSDLSQFSMLDLFRLEVDGQKDVLTQGLLALERTPTDLAATQRDLLQKLAATFEDGVGPQENKGFFEKVKDAFIG